MDLITLATSVIPDRSVGFTATVIIAGLGIVLGTLAVLIVVFYIFGAIMKKSQSKAKQKAAKAVEDAQKKAIPMPTVPTPAPAPAPVIEQGISQEVVAAISAAVYCAEGSNNFTIQSIRKQNPITGRNPWAQAAVVDNTRPF